MVLLFNYIKIGFALVEITFYKNNTDGITGKLVVKKSRKKARLLSKTRACSFLTFFSSLLILFVYFLPFLFLILCIKEFLYKTLSFLLFNEHASLSSFFILRFSGFWKFLNFFVKVKWVPLEFSNYESKTCEKSGNKTYYCLIWVKKTLHKINILSYLDHTFRKCVIT